MNPSMSQAKNQSVDGQTGDAPVLDQQSKLEAAWARIRDQLQTEFGDSTYRSWLKPLELADFDTYRLRLSVPSRFVRDWVQANYAARLRTLWCGEFATIQSVEIIVRVSERPNQIQAQPHTPSNLPPLARGLSDQVSAAKPARILRGGRAFADTSKDPSTGLIFGEATPLDRRCTFERFVVGKPNELAFAAAQRVADSSQVAFNPLFLYGGVGLGKTHLMHAIAWRLKEVEPERQVVYLSAEKFMWQFVTALRNKKMMEFKQAFRTVDVLMIDDIQFISGKEASQEEFFHTFNALVDQNHQIIVSADRPPQELQGLEDRLKSRLGWGLVADLQPTTYDLRLGILESKADHLPIEIPPQVLEFLAYRISSNVRELEGALNRLVAHSTLIGGQVTLVMAQEVLKDVLRANDRRITIEEIQKKVADHFAIPTSEMHSSRRARSVARPRQVAMYLSKQLTSRSLPEIGRRFGGRDHTTVMHAIRKVEELRGADNGFDEDVDLLRRVLEG